MLNSKIKRKKNNFNKIKKIEDHFTALQAEQTFLSGERRKRRGKLLLEVLYAMDVDTYHLRRPPTAIGRAVHASQHTLLSTRQLFFLIVKRLEHC